MTAKTTMIGTMIAADIGMKYWSAMLGGCVGCGEGVADVGSTAKDVTA